MIVKKILQLKLVSYSFDLINPKTTLTTHMNLFNSDTNFHVGKC